MKFALNLFVATLLSSTVFAQSAADPFSRLSTVPQTPVKVEPIKKFYDDSEQINTRMPPSDLLHIEFLDKKNVPSKVLKEKDSCYCGFFETQYALLFTEKASAELYENDDCKGNGITVFTGFTDLQSPKKIRSIKLTKEPEQRCSFGFQYQTPKVLEGMKYYWQKQNDEDN